MVLFLEVPHQAESLFSRMGFFLFIAEIRNSLVHSNLIHRNKFKKLNPFICHQARNILLGIGYYTSNIHDRHTNNLSLSVDKHLL